MSFVISTDTSANLPTAELQWHQLYLLPFSYIVNEVEHQCLDLSAFDGDAYYEMLRHTPASTSMISMDQYRQLWEPLLEEGHDILHVGMSSGISGSFGSAKLAAGDLREEFPGRDIQLVDTLGASLGEGILVLRAIEMRENGASLSETAAALRDMRWRMYQIFTVDDIMYLRRTGRLSNAKAIVASVLHIKPVLKGNEEGAIVAVDKIRGRRKSIDALVERYRKYVVSPETQTVGIAHADCAEDAEYLASALRIVAPPKEIMTVMYEPVTGSHVGPGALALFFLGDENVRSK